MNGKITTEVIKDLDNLTSLSLRDNFLFFDEDIETFTNLTSLDLSYNTKITGNGIRDLTKLTTLSLESNSRITDNDIDSLTNLTNLNLSQNRFISDNGIKNLTKLTSLQTLDNYIITLEAIKSLVNLTKVTGTTINYQSDESIINQYFDEEGGYDTFLYIGKDKPNPIFDKEMKKFTDMIQQNTTTQASKRKADDRDLREGEEKFSKFETHFSSSLLDMIESM
jgi:Leucine-rich repeat (LRR) protein